MRRVKGRTTGHVPGWYTTLPAWPGGGRSPSSEVAAGWRALPVIAADSPPNDARPIERAATELSLYDWWIAAEPWAARALLERCGGLVPERLSIATVGAATPWLLADYDLQPRLTAESLDHLSAQLAPRVGRQERLLAPTGTGLGDLLDPLRKLGAEVASPIAYDPKLTADAARELERIEACETPPALLFTDPAAVGSLLRHRPELARAIQPYALDAAVSSALTLRGMEERAVGPEVESIVDSLLGGGPTR